MRSRFLHSAVSVVLCTSVAVLGTARADDDAEFVRLMNLGKAYLESSVLFAVGFWHRLAAVVLILLLGLLQLYDVQDLGPGVASGALALALHVFVPATPFGSWSARGLPDPTGGWRMPGEVHLAAWVFLSLLYIGQGIALYHFEYEHDRINEMLLWCVIGAHGAFGLLCIAQRLRPWVWLVMLGVQVFLIFSPLQWWWVVFVLPLHAFAFDPAWIPPARLTERVVAFYDGSCGLCHRTVRFLLSEDVTGQACSFAPLQDAAGAAS